MKRINLTPTLAYGKVNAQGGLTLESATPISGKAQPVQGLYHVTLTPAQAQAFLADLSNPKSAAAAVKAGYVSLPTGQRGRKAAPRTNVLSAIKAAQAARKATPKGDAA